MTPNSATDLGPDGNIHPQADVKSRTIGDDTRIWQFCVVLENARIGRECNINAHCFIENDVTIGDRVTVKCGVQLWDGITIEDDVFIGPNVTFTNDKMPRSKQYPDRFSKTVVRREASLGANATILPGIEIGSRAMIGAGAVVTRNVPPNAIVVGNPARIVGYVDTPSRSVAPSQKHPSNGYESVVEGVRLHELSYVPDMRGDLCVAEWEKDIPFSPARVFFVYNVPSARVRGEHAHKVCQQFLLCVSGKVGVVVDDGSNREEFTLDKPWLGLYLPAGIWGIQYKYSPDAVLMVLASHPYDPDDYIRDYDQFLDYVKAH